MVKVRPDYRQFLAETFVWLAIFCVAIGMSPFLVARFGTAINIADMILSIALFLFLVVKYFAIRSVCWLVDEETLCQQKGVFVKRTDYIELYRVVDYVENQTLLQRVFGVKTVTIMSTDKTDAMLHIYGVPSKFNLIHRIRNKVEICKSKKRVYEITNN